MGWEILRLAAYRFRTTFRRRRGGLVALFLLVGLVGGLAMASVAGARRTASSFTTYWASTNPSDLVGETAVLNSTIGSYGYDVALVAKIAGLPHVGQVESVSGIDILPLRHNGAPLNAPNFGQPSAGNGSGSVNGLYLDQDKVTVTQGRMADPRRTNELMLSAQGATALGVHVGSVLPVGIYTNAQTVLPAFGTATVKPIRIIDEKVVGIFVFPTSVIEDAVDAPDQPNNIFTPALTRQLLGCCVNYTTTALRVRGGPADVAEVAGEISKVLPPGFPAFTATPAEDVAKAQRAIKPEAIALGAFGAIVAAAALLIATQLIGRQLRLSAGDRDVLRALGVGTTAASTDGLLGILGAIVSGALLAAVVAVLLSPVAPLGPVRPVYPYRGISLDWTVIGAGVAVLVVGLSGISLLLGWLRAPHRERRRERLSAGRASRAVSIATNIGLPAPAVTGARFALEPSGGRDSLPARSVIAGTALAVVAVVATLTFGASLSYLVSHPALYGWNWDYILYVEAGDIPQGQVMSLLDHDRYVSHWSGIYTTQLDIDGQAVPVLGENPGAAVAPPLLSGHELDRADQVVLGALTLAQLHKTVGDTVQVTSGLSAPRRLRIVGTAAMPVLGSDEGGIHLEMATGAVLASQLLPAIDRNPFDDPVPGPNGVLIRLKDDGNQPAGLRSLQKIAQDTSNTANFGVTAQGVQSFRPAEIVNYRSMGDTPVFLGAGLAAGAVTALALTLAASIRRRRRDFALLKTLGFTRGQLAATVSWQSTTTVVIGAIVGVPVGIALGRWLWDLFARNIHAVPDPSVPVILIAAVAAGALLLANVVAAGPGRNAARTPTALLLRTE